MNIGQVRTKAETQSPYLTDSSCIKTYVGSLASNPGAARITTHFQNAIDQLNLEAKVIRTGSFGCFDLEPIVIIDVPDQPAVLYSNASPDGAVELIKGSVQGPYGNSRPLCCIGDKKLHDIPLISELQLFNLQNRISLRNCGWIDPEDISHYILAGRGYTGFSQVLKNNRRDLTDTLLSSALKGRGDSGCSSADKWKQFAGTENSDKYLICNAVDPDPKSWTSRLLLESDPHSVLEGILISAYFAGASHCFICVEENAAASERIQRALEQARTYNLHGSNILDSEFCCEIEIKETPSSLLTGYRIELFRCIEENQPLPHMLPAFPAIDEISGKTALMVNPEIMSGVSAVFREDIKNSRASKVVTLSGNVNHRYTVEVPHGMTIRDIVDRLGGGVPKGKTIKAVQLGGLFGVFIAPDDLDLPVDCDAAEESCSNIGSGTIEVMDSGSSILNTAKDIMKDIQAQSCGKCVFCREGCLQMLTILEAISENKRRPQDLDLLIELGEEMRAESLCAFGRSASNPILSSLKLFRDEYEI